MGVLSDKKRRLCVATVSLPPRNDKKKKIKKNATPTFEPGNNEECRFI
jgi:hypothetical protein